MADIDSFADEFARLAVTEGLTKGSKAYRNGRRTFFATSVATGFEEHFGHNVADLKAWQDLCKTAGIKDEDVPQSIKKCKKALTSKFVNIVDLVDARRQGKVVKAFQSADALRKYIQKTGKIFPKEAAKRNPLLKAFLITVF